jgi:hypothetical protein
LDKSLYFAPPLGLTKLTNDADIKLIELYRSTLVVLIGSENPKQGIIKYYLYLFLIIKKGKMMLICCNNEKLKFSKTKGGSLSHKILSTLKFETFVFFSSCL